MTWIRLGGQDDGVNPGVFIEKASKIFASCKMYSKMYTETEKKTKSFILNFALSLLYFGRIILLFLCVSNRVLL